MHSKIYYLYRHIRIDKNEPFYVGIGVKRKKFHNTFKSEYERAFATKDRNSIWKKIVIKTEYTIDILFETSSIDIIKQKEIEFIDLYGRIKFKTGTLANISGGGDLRDNIKGIKTPEHIKEKHRNITKINKKVIQYDENGKIISIYRSLREAGRQTGINYKTIGGSCKNLSFRNVEQIFFWRFYDEKGDNKLQFKFSDFNIVVHYQEREYSLSEFGRLVSSKTGISESAIHNRIKRGISPEDCFKPQSHFRAESKTKLFKVEKDNKIEYLKGTAPIEKLLKVSRRTIHNCINNQRRYNGYLINYAEKTLKDFDESKIKYI